MNLRKKLLATVAAVVLTASTALTGVSQSQIVSDTSSVTIGSGSFSTSLSASDFANLPYSLEEQRALGGSIVLTVNDQRGTAEGWTVTVTLTDFIGETRPDQFIPARNLEITSATITVAATGSQPVTETEMPFTTSEVPGQPQLIWTANPGYGQGAYHLNLTADLIIPGRTQAQTYTSIGTVNVVTAP